MNILKRLLSIPFSGLYTLLLAISIGAATFIENDYGTASAKQAVYNARWFEILIFLFTVSLINNIFKFKMYKLKKLPVFIFHIAIIITILGAAITRYISYEGSMPIREGATSNTILSEKSYLSLDIKRGEYQYPVQEEVLFGSLLKNRFSREYRVEEESVEVELLDFIPNAVKELRPVPDGVPILHVVASAGKGREDIYLTYNKKKSIGGTTFVFAAGENNDVNFFEKNDSIFFKSTIPATRYVMATRQTDTLAAGLVHPFRQKALYSWGNVNLVLKDFISKGKLVTVSKSARVADGALDLVKLKITTPSESKELEVWGSSGMEGTPSFVTLGDLFFAVSYGAKRIELPFYIKLNDFQLETYPGSKSPSSYASEVTLIDDANNVHMDYRIYMNHILNYGGYRFFQSSYDPDQKGTILSVNHDYWGTLFTYIGYFLLALGMFWALFSKKTRFAKLSRIIDEVRKKKATIITAFLLLSSFQIALATDYTLPDTFKIIDYDYAREFGKLLVQDNNGRIKPLNTLASEVVRKVSKKEKLFGQHPSQVFLGMLAFPHQWQNVPMIKVYHPRLKKLIGLTGKRAEFNRFFDKKSGYILQSYVEEASRKRQSDRDKFDKDVLKVDERVNILYTVFYHYLFKVFPKEDDPNHTWYSTPQVMKMDFGEANVFVHKFPSLYFTSIDEAVSSGNWDKVYENHELLKIYQTKIAGDIIPSDSRIKFEILYNDLQIFTKLAWVYLIVGFILIVLLFIQLFIPGWKLNGIIKLSILILFLSFLVHIAGLGIRWYISGHSPWSNGYESMIYIAFATMLAGLIFAKKSPISLAATALLSSWILIVASMSWMDPEITTLVPVLKSYWLTIHVSVIVASYGPLALGALLGIINLILMILRNQNSNERISLTITELSAISEKSLTIGLYMLTIGTFLGGVWANESWGRYWGWDAKETWSLVSVLVYAFTLHMRFIKGLRGEYAFNLAALLGFGSILMTYFGVNFYLSGLHSYAAGDPVPIPVFVYYMLIGVVILGVTAYFRSAKWEAKK